MELANIIYAVTKNNELKLNIKKPLQSINEIEISGIYGRGNYDITLLTSKNENINLTNIELFSNNEKISLIKIEI